MKTSFLFKVIVIIITTTLQTHAMEQALAQELVKGDIQNRSLVNQHSYQIMPKDEQTKFVALLNTTLTTHNPNLIQEVSTHAWETDKVQLNSPKPNDVCINIDLLEKDQKLEQELDQMIKQNNTKIETNGKVACCNETTCGFIIMPGSCYCGLLCFIIIFPILAITGVLPHAT